MGWINQNWPMDGHEQWRTRFHRIWDCSSEVIVTPKLLKNIDSVVKRKYINTTNYIISTFENKISK